MEDITAACFRAPSTISAAKALYLPDQVDHPLAQRALPLGGSAGEGHNPAESIDLPANGSKSERIATPGEFVYLLDQLDSEDAVSLALAAGRSNGRRSISRMTSCCWPATTRPASQKPLAGSSRWSSRSAPGFMLSGSARADLLPASMSPTAQGQRVGHDLALGAPKAHRQSLARARPQPDRDSGLPATPRPSGSTTPRSAPRSPLYSWGTELRSARRRPGQPCSAAPAAFCPASWSVPATNSMPSWLSAPPKKRAHPLSSRSPQWWRSRKSRRSPSLLPSLQGKITADRAGTIALIPRPA